MWFQHLFVAIAQVDTETNCCGLCFAVETAFWRRLVWVRVLTSWPGCAGMHRKMPSELRQGHFEEELGLREMYRKTDFESIGFSVTDHSWWSDWPQISADIRSCRDLGSIYNLLLNSCLNPTNLSNCQAIWWPPFQCVFQCQFSWPQIYYSHYSRYLETKHFGFLNIFSAVHCNISMAWMLILGAHIPGEADQVSLNISSGNLKLPYYCVWIYHLDWILRIRDLERPYGIFTYIYHKNQLNDLSVGLKKTRPEVLTRLAPDFFVRAPKGFLVSSLPTTIFQVLC